MSPPPANERNVVFDRTIRQFTDYLLYEKDFDELDPFCDHLLVIDHNKRSTSKSIVGTYRLIRRPMTQIHGKFYTEGEFDIKKILKTKGEILELGRSCVDKNYRDKPIIKLLWKAISAYMEHYKIKILFGCASFPGINYKKYKEQLSFLYHYHLAPESIRPKALLPNKIQLNYYEKKALNYYDFTCPIITRFFLLKNGSQAKGKVSINPTFVDKSE